MQHRKAIGGVFLAMMVISTVVAGLLPSVASYRSVWPGGLFALFAAVLLLPDAGAINRIQLGLLVSVGLTLLGLGWSKGADIDWPALLSQNTGLLTMVMSVGLLKLIIAPGVVKEKLPQGRKAFLHTLLSLSVFGSTINISAPILISDRLTLNRPMDYFSSGIITRVFCMCSAWSPFFAGTAVVLTALPNVHFPTLVVSGLPLLLIAIAGLYWFNVAYRGDKVATFHGYPIQPDSLLVPIFLAVMVFLGSQFFSDISILIVISLSAISLTFVMLLVRDGAGDTLDQLQHFVVDDLPKRVAELTLFLSAGILASGLQAMVQVGSLAAPFSTFSSTMACILLAVMIVIAMLGIHPVIQVAAMTPLILVTNPDLELLGVTYLFAWALGTCGSPLSGTNLVMQGRYGIIAWRGAVQNWPFVACMYLVACVLLFVRGWLG